MGKVELIISINVYQKPEYLQNQIDNINQFVKVNKVIILNCNEFMYNEIYNINIPNTIINPIPLNKTTNHGSLTQGIVSNMRLAFENYDFEYFLVLCSRDFFYNELKDVSELKKHDNFLGRPIEKRKDYETDVWWYPYFRKSTKFFKFIESKQLFFSHSAHEGLCLTKESCEYILEFMNSNREIELDLYSVNHPAEEFGLQTLAVNSKTGTFYYIGNGVEDMGSSPIKFTQKRAR